MRTDSFVVETDVHYPTDLNLLWDALRKLIEILAGLCEELGILGWRQSAYQLRQLKTLYRQVQRLKHSTSQDPEKRAAKQEEVRAAHRAYLEHAEALLARVRATRVHLIVCHVPPPVLEEVDLYLGDAERQTPWRSMAGTAVWTMASRASSAMWPWPWWRATSSASAPCCASRRRSDSGGPIDARPEHHRRGRTATLAGSVCRSVGKNESGSH